MTTFDQPAWLLLLIPTVPFTLWAWYSGHVNLTTRRRAAALAIRLVLLGSIVLGLAGFSLQLPQTREATVFVADLSASDARARTGMEHAIDDASAVRGPADESGVVSVAADAAVEQPVSPISGFGGFQTPLDASSTDLERGLELAASILPDGYRQRVVLLSDGQQTEGDAVLAARLLHSRGIRVDVLPQHVSGGPDVLLDSVTSPSQLRTRERSTVTVRLKSTVDTSARVDLFRDRSLIVSRQEHLRIGSTTLTFLQPSLSRGFHAFEVQVTPRVDSQPGNNTGSAFTIVGGPPRVLVVTSNPGEARNVLSALRTTGIATDMRAPGQIVPSLPELQKYASIMLVDTPAEALGPELMKLFVPYVRDLGHGLVVIGGQQSYGLGAYGQTPLERALPVKMDLPKRPDLPSVGVVLIVESLEANLPINISKNAAKGVIQLLTEEDRVAVNDVPDDGGPGWVIRLRPVTNKAAIDHAIDEMKPGDPQTYAPALQAAFKMLSSSPTRLRHIILLGDGDARDKQYGSLARFMRKHGTTISTIVTNALTSGDRQTMHTIASAGGGRYYNANDVKNIPRIFLHEARTVARSGIVRGHFTPRAVSANPMLRDLHTVPPLEGYVATTLKQRAEMVLASDKLDPVLAGWQFGLGRSVVWTSDAAGFWSRDFIRTPGTNRFWADLVSWTLPASQGNQLFVTTSRRAGQARIAVDLPSNLGTSPQVQATVSGPHGVSYTVQLQPAAPQQDTGSFPASQQGSYFVTVQARGNGHVAIGHGGTVVPYPDEYRLSGTDLSTLQAIADAGGGSVLAQPTAAWSDSLPAAFDHRTLTELLWLIAILLLPVDVAVRRLIVTRRDIEALRAALGRIRQPPQAA